MTRFAILAGLRPGEIFGLKWGHLSDTHVDIRQRVYRGRIDSPKISHSLRKAALAAGLLDDIRDWKTLSRDSGEDVWDPGPSSRFSSHERLQWMVQSAELVFAACRTSICPLISVVIPSDRVGASLCYCLHALSRQTLSRSSFEIVLILDGVEISESIIAALAGLPIRVYAASERVGRSRCRNIGLLHSTGDIIVSLDGDMIAHPDLLSYFLEQHQHGQLVCVGSRTFARAPLAGSAECGAVFRALVSECLDRPDYRDVFYRQTDNLTTAAEPFWALSTCNCSYPRAFANFVGGFDENIRGWGLEDQEFGYRLWKTGELRFVYLAEAAAIHIEHERDLELQANSWRANREYFELKHGAIFANPRLSVRMPVRIHPSGGWDAIA